MLSFGACQVDSTHGSASMSPSSSLTSPSSEPSPAQIPLSSSSHSTELATATEHTADSVPSPIINELTVLVLTPDGKPVSNIGVYGNPTQSSFLASSTISYAVTDNEGIAILQRVRESEEPNEVITVGLVDRNQSDVIQQTVSVALPDSGLAYEPQPIVWNKTLPMKFLQQQTETITLKIVNPEGDALPNIWVKLGLPARTAPDGSNNEMGYQEDLPYADRHLITGEDGTCTFSNVGKGTYSIGLCGGIGSFNLVQSDNPRLQAGMVYPDKSIQGTTIDYTEGGKQAFILQFIPCAF